MDLKIFAKNIDEKSVGQIYELLAQPAFKDAKVRIMPDVHAGAGCVIGFTADLGNKVIPNVVGVDIGCGMHVVEFGKIDIDLEQLDEFIKANIPAGFAVNAKSQYPFDFDDLHCYNKLQNVNRLALGIGSLGGGNHFIEVDVDESDNKYLVIHTGSRNLGKQVACIYQDLAIDYCRNLKKPLLEAKIKELKAQGKQLEINDEIAKINKEFEQYSVPKDLCYLEDILREHYLHDMRLCQLYAVYNRYCIANKIKAFLNAKDAFEWECMHNYIDDYNIVRKGAIAAHKGKKVIIPLNMRDGSIIGIGKGNPEWNESGPHGAGRILSRSQAKKELNVDEFKKQMDGIYTTTANESTIDESPMAYKPIDDILDVIEPTVDVISIIKPIYNFKAGEE